MLSRVNKLEEDKTSYVIIMKHGRQATVKQRTRHRNQEWVEGWISWVSLQARLGTLPPPPLQQRPPSRNGLVRQWLSENQNVTDTETGADEESDTDIPSSKEKAELKENPNNISFVILPFSRRVLPIFPTNAQTPGSLSVPPTPLSSTLRSENISNISQARHQTNINKTTKIQ